MLSKFKKLISLVFATVLLTSISSTSFAIDKLHFVIGGGAGGGWDGTARGTGEALTKAGFLKSASFENCLLYTSPSPRDRTRSRMPSSA